jgi:glycosyltransferase involved in cell wall biosynthesis
MSATRAGLPKVDVSVVIPTYNRWPLLKDALESCFREQELSGLRVEVVVVDDASTDGSCERLGAETEGLRLIRLQRNAGQCVARNAGLQAARGEYVKFLDSDDVLEERAVAREVETARREGADIVTSDWGVVVIDEAGNRIEGSARIFKGPDMHPLPDSLLAGRAVPTSAALYRRGYIDGLTWDPAVRKLDDWDWFCGAALRYGRIVSTRGVSYWMRVHRGARVTSSASMVVNARDHHRVLAKIEEILLARDELTVPRARRLAQYYYKELRVLCLYDRPLFDDALGRIYALDPEFAPVDEERQWSMRLFARAVGTRSALRLHSWAKRSLGPVVRWRNDDQAAPAPGTSATWRW